jgi:NAD(P)-dependent dehydrogenase (short-subunit alcohol dehydrogenase family)
LDQFRLNVVVPLQLSMAVARAFWCGRAEENRRDNPNIIRVSSITAINVYANRGQGIYGAAKAALNQLTRHMAHEFGAIGVRSIAIGPNTFPDIIPGERRRAPGPLRSRARQRQDRRHGSRGGAHALRAGENQDQAGCNSRASSETSRVNLPISS